MPPFSPMIQKRHDVQLRVLGQVTVSQLIQCPGLLEADNCSLSLKTDVNKYVLTTGNLSGFRVHPENMTISTKLPRISLSPGPYFYIQTQAQATVPDGKVCSGIYSCHSPVPLQIFRQTGQLP